MSLMTNGNDFDAGGEFVAQDGTTSWCNAGFAFREERDEAEPGVEFGGDERRIYAESEEEEEGESAGFGGTCEGARGPECGT